jgi:hypothetical protein
MAGLVLGNRGKIVSPDGMATSDFWSKLVKIVNALNPVSDGGFPRLPRYAKANIPSAVTAGNGSMVYCTDAFGGAEPVVSDGADWRRFSDRSVLS